MTLDESITAKGIRRFDLLRMPDEDFESLCFRLIRLDFPEAFKPASTSDGGADAVLPTPDRGYARCWQAKHHPREIHWGECKKSLAAAIEHWNPQQYTLCFPRELTAREQKTFDKHFRGPHMPRDADAMERYAPEFTLHATTDEAVKRVQEAMHGDREVQGPRHVYEAPTRHADVGWSASRRCGDDRARQECLLAASFIMGRSN